MMTPILVLFRHDLRLDDNRALSAAAETGRPVIPVFVHDELSPGTRRLGAARRWWLHHGLVALGDSLAALGSRLTIVSGAMADVVPALAATTGADAVLWNRRYDGAGRAADTAMKARLKDAGLAAESFDGWLLHEPFRLRTGAGRPFRVFTPFYRALRAAGEPRPPADAPDRLVAPARFPSGLAPSDLDLLPLQPGWADGLAAAWTPGEAGALANLGRFLDDGLAFYAGRRDHPALAATSRLSPHLANGEISPHRLWHAVATASAPLPDREKFLAELGWREFAWHLLYHQPDLAFRNHDPAFDAFPWRADAAGLRAWCRGRTGFPLVDAGMRQLWTTGWMHNRVRMVAASFLVKHLLIDWRLGEAWFWDTLVDADHASNPANWQWVAGSGADAAPYFRIFNPTLQGQRFDPDGAYVRSHVGALADAPAAAIHRPGHHAPAVVDHDAARLRALAALATTRP